MLQAMIYWGKLNLLWFCGMLLGQANAEKEQYHCMQQVALMLPSYKLPLRE